jgi:hypothetical protein
MSLILKAAKTTPIRIDIDIDTDAGRIKGHFTGHAHIRSKAQLKEFAERLGKLADDGAAADADATILREMYERFDGLANESGPLSGDAAFSEILEGPLSVHLTRSALNAYWQHLSGAREGNSQPARAR